MSHAACMRPLSRRAGSIGPALVLVAACGEGGEPGRVACELTQPLVQGSRDANFLGLSPEQQTAIGRLRPTGAPLGAFCTGVLVAPGWVLTARHCDAGGVLFFETASGQTLPTSVASLRKVESVEHDALLIEIPVLETARPIAPAGSVDDGLLTLPVQLAGYGLTEDGAPSSELLFLAQRVSAVQQESIIVDGGGRAGACAGDSGGPMLIRDGDGAVVVAGILSNGDASCVGEDRYIRVDVLSSWIDEQIGAVARVQEPCGGLPATGLCYGATAVWCDGGLVTGERCGGGSRCGWSERDAGYRCVSAESDPCRGVTSFGACGENAALHCERGLLTREECGCQASCAWNPSSAGFDCSGRLRQQTGIQPY